VKTELKRKMMSTNWIMIWQSSRLPVAPLKLQPNGAIQIYYDDDDDDDYNDEDYYYVLG